MTGSPTGSCRTPQDALWYDPASGGGSPFAELMKQGAASAEEYTTDVLSNYRGELG